MDINPFMLQRGKVNADNFNFGDKFIMLEADINNWEIDNNYDVIMANHSLHHFQELELLFEKINKSLDDEGFFLINDIIGRNGHMRWPEALEVLNIIWNNIAERYKYNHQLKRLELLYDNWDCSTEGFEGIRAQDILPLLIQYFSFDAFIAYGNLINIFCDRAFGHNFNNKNSDDLRLIDMIAQLDDFFIENGIYKPTNLVASMKKKSIETEIRYIKNLTPEFCVRS